MSYDTSAPAKATAGLRQPGPGQLSVVPPRAPRIVRYGWDTARCLPATRYGRRFSQHAACAASGAAYARRARAARAWLCRRCAC